MNARSMAGMEQHSDIMELRARYELAAAAPLTQFADGLIFLAGCTRPSRRGWWASTPARAASPSTT
jgi:hypothetical protein